MVIENQKNVSAILEINKMLQPYSLSEIREKNKGKMRFIMYQNSQNANADISELELSVRSFNCLKRAQIDTVGQLVDKINGKDDLLRMRNLGEKSADEIMLQLFLYQYTTLSPEKKVRYVETFKKLNKVRC